LVSRQALSAQKGPSPAPQPQDQLLQGRPENQHGAPKEQLEPTDHLLSKMGRKWFASSRLCLRRALLSWRRSDSQLQNALFDPRNRQQKKSEFGFPSFSASTGRAWTTAFRMEISTLKRALGTLPEQKSSPIHIPFRYVPFRC
jgi:hypothetical protein